MLLQYMCKNKYALQMLHMPISSHADMQQLFQYIHNSNELIEINTVTMNTGLHKFHIIGIWP